MRKSQKISYDKDSQVLSIEMKKAKSVDSDIQGNAVIDYDKNGEVVRINFYNFSFDNFRSGLKAIKAFARRGDLAIVLK